jgi:hypothetical protein
MIDADWLVEANAGEGRPGVAVGALAKESALASSGFFQFVSQKPGTKGSVGAGTQERCCTRDYPSDSRV